MTPTGWFDRLTLVGAEVLSDGVPELIGQGDSSRKIMPPPPPGSVPVETDKTRPQRRPPWTT